MIDAVLQLKSQHHQGKIITLSRRGLIPQTHEDDRTPWPLDSNLFPIRLKDLVKFIREEIKKIPPENARRQAFFRAIRLKANAIWSTFTLFEKKQFLRHLLPYWDIQRHQVPPEVSKCLDQLFYNKSLELIKGRLIEFSKGNAIIQPRHTDSRDVLNINWIINCTCPGNYLVPTTNPIIDSLISQGLSVISELNPGLKIAPTGAMINNLNSISNNLFAIGPPCKGVLYERSSVREIRRQIFDLTKLLLSHTEQNSGPLLKRPPQTCHSNYYRLLCTLPNTNLIQHAPQHALFYKGYTTRKSPTCANVVNLRNHPSLADLAKSCLHSKIAKKRCRHYSTGNLMFRPGAPL
jgi:uncharacterized NAD(P)/FAD-binding protein YdhS